MPPAPSTGLLTFENAGDVTLAKHGRLKARGDFIRRGGIVGGGKISLTSAGTMRIDGTIDVSGDSAGRMTLRGNGDIVFGRSAKIRGNGISSFADLGKRYADGGLLEVYVGGRQHRRRGPLQLRGANGASGGNADFFAARDVKIRGKMDVSGGALEGGIFTADPGDNLTSRAPRSTPGAVAAAATAAPSGWSPATTTPTIWFPVDDC